MEKCGLLVCLLGVMLALPALGAGLEAGVAVGDITPAPDQLSISDRPACEGVHDPLSVRALALRANKVTVVLAAVDVIGMQGHALRELRRQATQPGLPPEHIFLCATHCHSAPDVMGVWNGVPPAYLAGFNRALVATIKQAVANLQPARAAAASFELPPKTVINWRDPGIVDRTGSVLMLKDAQGRAIATLVNFACHAEVMGTHQPMITADFPGYLRASLEQALGGKATFINGALGGMVSPDNVYDGKEVRTWEETERIGKAFAGAALAALRKAEPVSGTLSVKVRPMVLPVDNPAFVELGKKVNRQDMIEQRLQVEIAEVRLGSVQMVTIPGELLPRLGLELRGMMTGKCNFVLGLTNDELGYLIPADDFREGQYEEKWSPGPNATKMLMREYQALLGK